MMSSTGSSSSSSSSTTRRSVLCMSLLVTIFTLIVVPVHGFESVMGMYVLPAVDLFFLSTVLLYGDGASSLIKMMPLGPSFFFFSFSFLFCFAFFGAICQ
jgi:hypothetical protein